MFHKEKKSFGCWRWMILLIGVFSLLGIFTYKWVSNLDIEKILSNGIIKQQVVNQLGEDNADLVLTLLPELLGFGQERRTWHHLCI